MTTKTLIFQIADDDQLLPGVEGKIVVWVEEEKREFGWRRNKVQRVTKFSKEGRRCQCNRITTKSVIISMYSADGLECGASAGSDQDSVVTGKSPCWVL